MMRSHVPGRGEARRGMVAAQVAVSLTALIGMLALLVDGGLLFSERRHAQATADSAALAAASDLYYNWSSNKGSDSGGTGKTSALNVASSNGYTNDGKTNSVTVNIPPTSGSFSGDAGYAEVIVTWNQQRGFSGILGSGTIPVSARAVAQGRAVSGTSLPGILLLGNTGTTLTAKGNGTVDVTDPKGYTGKGGSIYVDSNSSNAIVTTGNASVTAPSIYLAGSSYPAGVTASGNGGITTGATQMPDPLGYLPVPTTSSSYSGISVVSLPSGITSSMTLSSNTIYLVGGSGISLSGNATLTGNNVMIYFTDASASMTLHGNASVTLTPMTSGPYAGISLFDNRDATDLTLTGNGNLNVSGTIYAPSAGLTAVGNGTTDVFGSQVIANSMTLKGNGTVNVKFDQGQAQSATRNFGLVE